VKTEKSGHCTTIYVFGEGAIKLLKLQTHGRDTEKKNCWENKG